MGDITHLSQGHLPMMSNILVRDLLKAYQIINMFHRTNLCDFINFIRGVIRRSSSGSIEAHGDVGASGSRQENILIHPTALRTPLEWTPLIIHSTSPPRWSTPPPI